MRMWSTHWVWVWSSFQQFLIARRLLLRSGLILAHLSTLVWLRYTAGSRFPARLGFRSRLLGNTSHPYQRHGRGHHAVGGNNPHRCVCKASGCGVEWINQDLMDIYIYTWYNGIINNEYLLKTLRIFLWNRSNSDGKTCWSSPDLGLELIALIEPKKPAQGQHGPTGNFQTGHNDGLRKMNKKFTAQGCHRWHVCCWRWRCHDFRVPRTLDRCMAWTFDSAA